MIYKISQTHIIAKEIGNKFKQFHLQLVTAESCTGGQLAQTITSVPGASDWFERGFVTYSNLAKQQVLGVDASLINRNGPVSEKVVLAMAAGALNKSPADISIAITGITGPDGGTEKLAIGTIWTAWIHKNVFSKTECQHYLGDRLVIRYSAVEFALQTLLNLITH